MLDNETKRRIDTARDILVGKVPDPKSQVEQITIALVYKFMDDMDKDSVDMGGKASFFTGEYERYAWSRIFDPHIGGFEMLNLYAEAIVKLNHNPGIPQLFRDIFKNAYLPYRDPETLKLFLKTINEFHYDHSEKLGDAFEYLLSVLGSQGDAGQFRTPRHIIDFMVQLVKPQKHEIILDPACGTAGFLISAYKHIVKENTKKIPGDQLLPDERKRLLTNFKGFDISPDMVRLSLVNMYLHGFVQPLIYEYDTLTSEDRWNEYADVILANPPFMSPKGGIKPHKRFSVQCNRSEVLFVDYIAEHLTPSGRSAVIVPEGIIFQSAGAYKQLRKMLVEKFLYAVVSLPAGVFNPYSGVKTSILLMDRQLARKTESVLFVKIDNDGFGLGAQRREIVGTDLPDAIQIIDEYVKAIRSENSESFKADDQYTGALLVTKTKLAENGEYTLTGDRYRITKNKGYEKWPMVSLGEICEFINGKAFNSEDWEKEDGGGLPIIRIQNLNNPLASFNYTSTFVEERYIVNNGDLLFSWSGSRGTSFGAHIWPYQKGVLNQHIFRVLPYQKVKKKYLYYALNRSVKEIEENLHGGVGLVHITKGNLIKIQIPLPPLEVQQEIVAEIESYQKIIDGARQVVENWKPQIEIDPAWPMVRLGDIAVLKYGYTASAQEIGTARFIRITDISDDGTLIEDGAKFIDIDDDNKDYTLDRGDLLVARTGATFGKTLLFKQKMLAIYASYLIRIRFPNNTVLPEYYWAFAQSQEYWNQAQKLMTGGGQPQFNGNVLKEVVFPLPSIDVQKGIITKISTERNFVDGCRELIAVYEGKIKGVIDKVWG